MNDDERDGDWEHPRDEEERRIGSLERELAAVSSNEDRKILWGIPIVLAFILGHYLMPSLINQIAVIVVVPLSIIGGLGWVIFANIRKKRNILIRRGLKCPQCGHLPHRINASEVYAQKKCPRCKTMLNTKP